jgi:hypothetical protein
VKTEHKTRPSFRKTPLLAGLVLACGLFTGNSSAQWVVTDPGHTFTTSMDMAQSLTEFLEQARRWQRQVQEYQDALTRLTSVMNNPSGLMASYTSDMKEVADDHGDDINCQNPGGGGLSVAELFSAIAPSLSDNVPKKQHTLCIQANHLRNMKYNEMVRIIKQTKKQSEKLDELIREAKSSNTEGNWRSAMLNGQVLIASSLVDMQYSQTRMAAYDQMIERVERDSVGLGRKAMNGKQTLMSAAISTVTLKTALEALE